MSSTVNSKCKICRRLNQKLFLKGERCLSPKCALVKKPYVPGPKNKKRISKITEYGRELAEKQKLKKWYNLREKQFKNYVLDVLGKKGKMGDASSYFIKILEERLDNVVFRLGFAFSRIHARQLVNHAHFLVNGKGVDVPSYQVKKGDKISIKPSSLKLSYFQGLKTNLKNYETQKWLKLNKETLEGEVIGEPTMETVNPPAEIPSIFEFYTK
jgi:small subunit ribosomal protein S4